MTVDSGSKERRTEVEIGLFIGGKTIAGNNDRLGHVAQPATGEIQARVAFASSEEFDQAVDAGERAFGEWWSLTVVQRAAIMFKVRELLHEHRDELATIKSMVPRGSASSPESRP